MVAVGAAWGAVRGRGRVSRAVPHAAELQADKDAVLFLNMLGHKR